MPVEQILHRDTFVHDLCLKCGSHGALFATPYMFAACPGCLAERLRNLRVIGQGLPDWVEYLQGAAEREVQRQLKAEKAELSVSFDDFYRCSGCSRLLHEKEACYHRKLDKNYMVPFCKVCSSHF